MFLKAVATTIVAVALLAYAGLAAADMVPSDQQVIGLFDAAAFGPSNGNRKGVLYKWAKPLRVRLVGRAPERYRGWAKDHVARLGRLTGLDVRVVRDIDADMVIYFVPRFSDVTDGRYNAILGRYVSDPGQIEAILQGYRLSQAICGGQVTAQGAALHEAIVFVPIDRLPQVVHGCIAAQATRVLGLLFALPAETASVLATDSPHSHLTALDERLLRLLYDRRLTPGMSRAAALAEMRGE